MTRDEIKKIIDGITDDQLKAILDINTADIGKAKQTSGNELETTKAALKTAQDDLAAAQTTIKELETKKGDAAALEAELTKYKTEAEERKAADAKAQETAERMRRFEAVLGDRKFSHDYIKNGVFADFEKLLADDTNKGKGDAELFDSLTKDKDGVFASQNPGVNMGGAGGGSNAETDDAQVRAIMGLPPEKA